MSLHRWQRVGQEPDYRFSLANERTFLAWLRTALALLAGGIALDQWVWLPGHLQHPGWLPTGLVVLAALLCLTAYLRWRGNQMAMRHAQPLPVNLAVALAAGCGLLICLAMGVHLWLR